MTAHVTVDRDGYPVLAMSYAEAVALVDELAELLDHFDRTTARDLTLRRRMAQRRSLVLARARAALHP